MSSQIPSFYRFFFTWFEPLTSLYGAYLVLAEPDNYLNSFIAPAAWSATRDIAHNTLLRQMGASFVYVSLSQAVLLRYTSDPNVWKILNGSLLGWDAILLYGLWAGLSSQGRLSLGALRAEDWTAIVPTVIITLLRAAVVAGVGFSNKKVPAKEL
ncbi:hypothetical protein BJY01DRAFT_228010 [Aspergillus pseudoustus]|uniref:DUF7704 domain-containing protein n=1 Tax=Aspergillus pseudoustus TaxID=1810923 RepID=A0ABR4IMW6_9EURO